MAVAAIVNIIMVKQIIIQIIKATGLILKERSYLFGILVLWVVLFGVVFYIPVKTVPGNNIALQAAIFGYKDYIFLGIISFLSSLTIAMQIKTFRQKVSSKIIVSDSALGGIGLFSGIISSIFGTATCSLCVGALFGFLGANSVILLVNNKGYVVLGSLVLLGLSIYLSSKRLNNTCDACQIS